MKQRKILSFILMMAMIMTMGVFASMNVSAANGDITVGSQTQVTADLTSGAAGTATYSVSMAGTWVAGNTFSVAMDGTPVGVSVAVTTNWTADPANNGLITASVTTAAAAGTYTFTVTGAPGGSLTAGKTAKGTIVVKNPKVTIAGVAAVAKSADSTNSPNGTSTSVIDGFVGDIFKARLDFTFSGTPVIDALSGTLKVGDSVTFLNMPAGLSAKVISINTLPDGTTANKLHVFVEITGTPTKAVSGLNLSLTIPKNKINSSEDITAHSISSVALNIYAADTITVGAVNVEGLVDKQLNAGVDVVLSRNGANSTFTAGAIETFNGTYLTAGKDVTDWFKNLPAGLKAVVKTGAPANSTTADIKSTLTITIDGTPEKASKVDEAMKIVVPKEALSNAKANDITVTIPSGIAAKYNVHNATTVKTQPKPLDLDIGDIKANDKISVVMNTPVGAVPAPTTYAWYAMKGESDFDVITSTAGATGATALLVATNAAEVNINPGLVATDIGTYYCICKVTTTYNGVTKDVFSDVVKVTVTNRLDKGSTGNTGSEVFVSGTTSTKDYQFDLDKEEIKVKSTFEIAAYSVNNGEKWKDFTGDTDAFNAMLPKLLDKGLTLVIADKKVDKKAKAPELGGTVVTFEKIEARVKPDKYVVNYLPNAASNEWALTVKGSNKEIDTTALHIQLALLPKGVKAPDASDWKNWGSLSSEKQVQEFGGEKSTQYAYRSAAYKNTDNGKLFPATKFAKIKVMAESKAPNLKVKVDKKAFTGAVKYKANMEIDGVLYKTPGSLKVYNGDNITIRIAATATKPRSAAQTLEVAGIPEAK